MATSPVHVLNLNSSVERWAKFMELNRHLNIERVPAVDGAALDRNALIQSGTMLQDCVYPPGSVGCALSHIAMWRRALAASRSMTVMEDDTVACANFEEESRRVLALLPANWDIVLWGYLFSPLFMWLDLGFSKAKLESYDRRFAADPGRYRDLTLTSWPIRIAHVFGLQCYTISPVGAEKLLAAALPLRKRTIPFSGTNVVLNDTGIDCVACGEYPLMQAFLCVPPLAIHNDIEESVRVRLGG